MPASSTPYAIQLLPLREQWRDTYRVLFFPGFAGVMAVLVVWLHWPVALLTSGCIGMLPSLWIGTPARMTIASDDRARIDAWLSCRRHQRTHRGWVPALPRALYFDSQIVRYDDDGVIGPLITLRLLRRHLLADPRLSA